MKNASHNHIIPSRWVVWVLLYIRANCPRGRKFENLDPWRMKIYFRVKGSKYNLQCLRQQKKCMNEHEKKWRLYLNASVELFGIIDIWAIWEGYFLQQVKITISLSNKNQSILEKCNVMQEYCTFRVLIDTLNSTNASLQTMDSK